MTLHMAWTITGTVDDIYRPGAITAAADDNLEQTAARLDDKDISAWGARNRYWSSAPDGGHHGLGGRVIRKRCGSLQVQVFAGRDPLTGRKRWQGRCRAVSSSTGDLD